MVGGCRRVGVPHKAAILQRHAAHIRRSGNITKPASMLCQCLLTCAGAGPVLVLSLCPLRTHNEACPDTKLSLQQRSGGKLEEREARSVLIGIGPPVPPPQMAGLEQLKTPVNQLAPKVTVGTWDQRSPLMLHPVCPQRQV